MVFVASLFVVCCCFGVVLFVRVCASLFCLSLVLRLVASLLSRAGCVLFVDCSLVGVCWLCAAYCVLVVVCLLFVVVMCVVCGVLCCLLFVG